MIVDSWKSPSVSQPLWYSRGTLVKSLCLLLLLLLLSFSSLLSLVSCGLSHTLRTCHILATVSCCFTLVSLFFRETLVLLLVYIEKNCFVVKTLALQQQQIVKVTHVVLECGVFVPYVRCVCVLYLRYVCVMSQVCYISDVLCIRYAMSQVCHVSSVSCLRCVMSQVCP